MGPLFNSGHGLRSRELIVAVSLLVIIIIARSAAPGPGVMCSLRYDLFSHLGDLISDQHYRGQCLSGPIRTSWRHLALFIYSLRMRSMAASVRGGQCRVGDPRRLTCGVDTDSSSVNLAN